MTQRPTHAHRRASLGRRYTVDSRDKSYPMAAVLKRTTTAPTRKTWALPTKWELDQGQTPECVAYSGKHWEFSAPIACRTGLQPNELYRRCKLIDGDTQDGTSSRSLMKVYQQLGMVSNYFWSDNALEVVDTVLQHGPVFLGVMWLEDMFDPNPDGTLNVRGPIAGGHEILVIGADKTRQRVQIQNSWSTSWGLKGRAYLSIADLGKLIEADGDACAAVECKAPSRPK